MRGKQEGMGGNKEGKRGNKGNKEGTAATEWVKEGTAAMQEIREGIAAMAKSLQCIGGRSRKLEERMESMERQLGRLVTMQGTMEKCLSMLCTLVETDTKMQGVYAWEREKASQRNRTSKCRGRKQDHIKEHRSITTKNQDMHAICQNYNSMRTCTKHTPGVCKSMMRMLRHQLRKASGSDMPMKPTEWFKMQVQLQPAERIISFLVCLWNRSFWVPWCTHSGSRVRLFTQWSHRVTSGKNEWRARTREVSEGEVLMKVDPPQVWTDAACTKFCEAWIWKIYGLCYKFVDDEMPSFDWDDPAYSEFTRLAKLWSATSCYIVHKDFEWNVHQLVHIDRSFALSVYRRIADRLKILRSAFL